MVTFSLPISGRCFHLGTYPYNICTAPSSTRSWISSAFSLKWQRRSRKTPCNSILSCPHQALCCASSVLLKWAFQARAHLQAVLQKPEVLYTFTTLWSASLFRTLPCNLISQYVLVRFYFSWLVSIDFATHKKKLPMFKCRENSWMRSTSPVLFRGNSLHFPLWQQLMNWGAQITVDIGSSIKLATHSHCWSTGWGQDPTELADLTVTTQIFHLPEMNSVVEPYGLQTLWPAGSGAAQLRDKPP